MSDSSPAPTPFSPHPVPTFIHRSPTGSPSPSPFSPHPVPTFTHPGASPSPSPVTPHSPGPWTSTSSSPVYHGTSTPASTAPVGALVAVTALAAVGVALVRGYMKS